MMTSFEQYNNASYNGVSYFDRGGSQPGGFKSAEFLYPDSDNYQIEQLGLLPKIFTREAQIPFDQIEAFESALNTPGTGTLVLPVLGLFDVKVISFDKSDSIQNIGLIDYTITFGQEVGKIEPTISPISISEVANQSEVVNTSANAFMDNSFSVINSPELKALNKNTVIFSLMNTINFFIFSIESAVRTVVNEENSDLNLVIQSIQEDLFNIVKDNLISVAISQLFEALNLVGKTAQDRYKISSVLFGIGSAATTIDNFPILQTTDEDLNISFRTYNLSFGYQYASQSTYQNQGEIDNVLLKTDEEFDFIIDSNQLDSKTRLSLIDLRTQTLNLLGNLEVNQISDFKTNQIASTVLSYKLYGNSTLSDQIVSLNQASNTAFISGDIEVLSVD